MKSLKEQLGEIESLEEKIEESKPLPTDYNKEYADEIKKLLLGLSSHIEERKNELESTLENKDESLKRPSFFTKLKHNISKESLETTVLASAYAAEIYFLGINFHEKMYSLAKSWYSGYDALLKSGPHDVIGAMFGHVLVDGIAGTIIGGVIGAAVGGLSSLTYNVIKKKEFAPFVAMAYTSIASGICAAVGGFLGAEFSDPGGIMTGAYIGAALGIAKTISNEDFS